MSVDTRPAPTARREHVPWIVGLICWLAGLGFFLESLVRSWFILDGQAFDDQGNESALRQRCLLRLIGLTVIAVAGRPIAVAARPILDRAAGRVWSHRGTTTPD